MNTPEVVAAARALLGDCPGMTLVAVSMGSVPFTQNETPWYNEASTQLIHMPNAPPHLLAGLVVAMVAAYLLSLLPGPAMASAGDPVPSSYS